MSALEQTIQKIDAFFSDPAANPRREPAHPRQRLYARTLIQRLDLDVVRVTPGLFEFFDAAQLPPPDLGSSVDTALTRLSKTELDALIRALLAEVPGE